VVQEIVGPTVQAKTIPSSETIHIQSNLFNDWTVGIVTVYCFSYTRYTGHPLPRWMSTAVPSG